VNSTEAKIFLADANATISDAIKAGEKLIADTIANNIAAKKKEAERLAEEKEQAEERAKILAQEKDSGRKG